MPPNTQSPLAAAETFAVLAGSGITNTGTTIVSGTAGGDIGSYPTVAFTGEGNVATTGTKYLAGETEVQQAKVALSDAYADAEGRTPALTISGDIGNQTLTTGVYRSESSIGLTGILTLDAGNDPTAVFVFQAGSTLTTAVGSTMVLANGAQACNVFWQVGSSATFGTDSNFSGTVIALTSITATTGAEFNGALLAQNGAVTLDSNKIVNDACAIEPAEDDDTGTDDTGTSHEDDTPSEVLVSPAPAPENGTVDGGALPNTGGIQWVIAAGGGAALLAFAADALRRWRQHV